MPKETENKRPTHVIWQVVGDGENARWNRIGAAFPNRDGKGFNLPIDAIPLTGHIVMREVSEKEDSENGGRK